MKNFSKRNFQNRRYYLKNHHIPNTDLRVIDDQGNQIGILEKNKAIELAKEKNKDLVLIAPNSQPPVAKIIEFSKFLYQENKKNKEAKKGIKKSITKDIKLSLFIGKADFERLINKAKEFLNSGNQVRLNLNLRGREIIKKEMAFDLINKFISQLEEVNISKPPRLEGRVIRSVVSRKK